MIPKWVHYGIFNTFILQCRVMGHMHDRDGCQAGELTKDSVHYFSKCTTDAQHCNFVPL